MRRAYTLIIVVLILVFSAFAVSLGWYYSIQKAVEDTVTGGTTAEEAVQETSEEVAQETTRKAELVLGKRAAYRKSYGADITVYIESIDVFEGSAEIYAELLYHQRSVSSNSVIIESISPGEKTSVTVQVNYDGPWSAFDVKQI